MGSRWRSRNGQGLLAAWFVLLVGSSAVLLGRHLLALPRPELDDAGLTRAVAGLGAPGKIPVVHVLDAACRCSQRIAAHLAASARPADLTETVLLVGDDALLARRLERRGFAVRSVTPDELARVWHVPAAPLLVVGSVTGELRYVGGYTTSKQAFDVRDRELVLAARRGRPEPLPLFGCAVSEDLRRELGPIGARP